MSDRAKFWDDLIDRFKDRLGTKTMDDLLKEADEQLLKKLNQQMRTIAAKIGPLHAFWDEIFDNEAFLAGKPTVLSQTLEQRIATAESYLQGNSNI